MTGAVLWLRRDLRRRDLPALGAAAASGPVTPLFVIDPVLWRRAGPVRRGWLAANLRAVRASYDGALTIRVGRPVEVVPAVAAEVGADQVQVSAETTPYGVRRDRAVARALGLRRLVATGSPYAVTPGRVLKPDGTGYQVFTPWARAWRARGWRAPAPDPTGLLLQRARSDRRADALLDAALRECPIELPPAGETAALARWAAFGARLDDYAEHRDRPDLAGTSCLSPYLKVGAIHPRTLLAGLGGDPGHERFRTELAWREFYADVLFRTPASAWQDLRQLNIDYDESAESFKAWAQGRTGFPIIDAGMRQLAATGWMHNRVRMITASFFVKDLHLWWPQGARFFLDALIDGDLASNSHGWQWAAGTGTDAAPYFRIFNPVTQARRFDPDGDYVRRWLPELASIRGAAVHEPGRSVGGYPAPLVEHDQERRIALARYRQARS